MGPMSRRHAVGLVERWFVRKLGDGVAAALEYQRYASARPMDPPSIPGALTTAQNPPA
jgi:hypothetical protein